MIKKKTKQKQTTGVPIWRGLATIDKTGTSEL